MKCKWNPCCCFCIELKTGAMAVGIGEIVVYTLGILLFSVVSSMLQMLTDDDSGSGGIVPDVNKTAGGVTNGSQGEVNAVNPPTPNVSAKQQATYQLLFTLNVFCAVGIIGGILLLFAVMKKPSKVSWFFRCWVVIKIVQTLAVMSLIGVDLVMKIWHLRIYYFVAWAVVKLYVFIVVYSHFHHVRSNLIKEESHLIPGPPEVPKVTYGTKDEGTETEPLGSEQPK